MFEPQNPYLPRSLRLFSAAVILVLLVGAGLFVAPEWIKPRWPWQLTPFNARFLGSFYIAELAIMTALLIWNRWSPARLILTMALVFTVLVTATSLVHLDVFNFGRKAAWVWFAVYAGSVLVSAMFLLGARELPGMPPAIAGHGWRLWLVLEAALLAIYGFGLLLLPEGFGGFWPWKIDAFHARTYSAIFITGAAGSWLLSRGAPREELAALGLAQLTVGLLAVLGLLITDAAVKRVDWSSSGTYAWLLLFAALAGTGLIKLALGIGRPPAR